MTTKKTVPVGKTATVETDRNGGIRIDSCYTDGDADLLLWKGFKFRFTAACWLVSPGDVNKTKERFKRLKLI